MGIFLLFYLPTDWITGESNETAPKCANKYLERPLSSSQRGRHPRATGAINLFEATQRMERQKRHTIAHTYLHVQRGSCPVLAFPPHLEPPSVEEDD